MSTLKVITGLACLIAALFFGLLAWASFVWGPLWFGLVPVVFTVGLVAASLFFILKRRSSLPKRAKGLVAAFAGILIVSPLILDIHIRHQRRALQVRAIDFLARPVPDMFKTSLIAGYQARPNQTVLSISRGLIERYARNGRIRWSAWIQGQMAVQPFETTSFADAAQSDPEARVYVSDCEAIIKQEWRMGFWQWVEDTMEMKRVIPEIEEEDVRPALSKSGASAQ
jgi:hypothetical protein